MHIDANAIERHAHTLRATTGQRDIAVDTAFALPEYAAI